jgi:acyl-CoA synthetase (AMP-forming)/AMP-acid ligase II
VPRAYVVLNEGAAATPAELRQFALTSLASFKVPREIVIREALPMSATGKVLKRELAGE